MESNFPFIKNRPSYRIGKSFPFLFALIVVVFIGWSAVSLWLYPDDGIRGIAPTGLISSIDPEGPSNGILFADDVILSINNVPQFEAMPFYGDAKYGDEVTFEIMRGEEELITKVILEKPSFNERMVRMMPLIVASIFLVIGFGVLAFGPQNEATFLLFWFFSGLSLLLTAGQISNVGPGWSSNIYNFLFWVIGPLSIHFHLYFPQEAKFKWKRLILICLYFIGIAGGSTYLIFGAAAIRSNENYPLMITLSRLWVSYSIIIVVGLLFYSYIYAASPGVKAKIRIVVLGGAISTLPLVTLILIPEALFHRPLQPYAYVLGWIGILPLTYGYSIFRYHLIEIERHVNRGATLLLVFSILVAIYMLLSYLLNRIVPAANNSEPFIDMFMVLCLAICIVPIHRQVQRVVDTAFYGGWYDYRSAVTQITWGLEQITELKLLAETVSERLAKTLRLEDTCVFLCDINGDFSVIEVAPHTRISTNPRPQIPTLPRSSLQYLLKIGREEKASLARALTVVTLSEEEKQLLNSEQVHLWVPIIGHGQVKGFLALGQKYGGDIFSAEDMDILRIVARQISPVIENIHLVTQLRQYATDLEKRVAERTAELHDAKERVEAILSSVGEGVFVTDLNLQIQAINTALERQSGYSETELQGKHLTYLLADENNPQQLEELQAKLKQSDTWIGELLSKRKNETQYDIQLTIAPVHDQNGTVVSFVGSQRDITHQKELDRLKDIFVADVSHELRTPTTNINLYLDLLDNAPQEKAPKYMAVLKEQGLLLRKLVEDILDLSRLTVGKTKKSEFVPIDINLLAEQVVTAHNAWAEASSIELEFSPQKVLPVIFGDRNQISRVITNLVSNSLQYTNVGKITVRTYEEGGNVMVEVSDTGVGIDPEDIDHIFERFYRGKQVRQSKIPGTGLGLAIVREIVDFHGGTIEVESNINNGTRFVIGFPTLVVKDGTLEKIY
jgi:PAS domain S-box-containing protein